NTNLHIVGADAVLSGITADAFGDFDGVVFLARAAAGTRASKTATKAGTTLFQFFGQTWDGSVYATNTAIEFNTVNLQSGSDHSGNITFLTTPTSSTSIAQAMEIQASGGMSIGNTTDPGIGSLDLNGQLYMPNVTQTSSAATGSMCWNSGSSPVGKVTV